jgi:hypothetical protein
MDNDELEIRELIVQMVEGDMEPDDLESALLDFAGGAEASCGEFVAEALGLLAEYPYGDQDIHELRAQLGAMNRSYWFELAPKDVAVTGTCSSISVISTEIGTPAAGVGTQRVAVRA